MNSTTPPARRWRDAQGEHIDTRGLPPPQPLVAVLQLLRQAPATGGGPVFMHHDRDPQLLYPELAAMGWSAERQPAPPGEVLLKLEPPA